MNGLDWLIVAVMFFSTLTAASQGFFFEMFSLVGSVIGYLLAAWNYRRAAAWFQPYVNNQWIADGAAFLVIFVAVCILAGIVGRVLSWIMKSTGLRWFDRLLGAAFGALRGTLIVAVLLVGMTSFGVGSDSMAHSKFAAYFQVVGRGAVLVGPDELRNRFQDGLKALEKLPHASGQ